jgi:hypothetical protein
MWHNDDAAIWGGRGHAPNLSLQVMLHPSDLDIVLLDCHL